MSMSTEIRSFTAYASMVCARLLSKLSQPRTSETLSQILNQKLKEEKDVLNTIAVVSFVLTDSNIYEQSLSYRLITSLCHTS
ncbi:CLUMA_CG014772, isoform A [Clunio marinus]|uniref:CLUMA_CG014772, isoform A n=1 Tax=Clunio marinus TaxID=568069 RepID=A0A1J1IM99_9DIPT|nr:CLUMA_CG014772, isoform A [Clunio marinus]